NIAAVCTAAAASPCRVASARVGSGPAPPAPGGSEAAPGGAAAPAGWAAAPCTCPPAPPAPPPSGSSPASTGTSISPAPCAEDIRNDHPASCGSDSRMPRQRKCRRDSSSHSPAPTTAPPQATVNQREATSAPVAVKASANSATEAACPPAIAGIDRSSAARLRSCSPRETATSHPMPGLRPWKRPRPTRAHSCPAPTCGPRSGEAVGVGGGVAALQPGLVHPQPAEVVPVGEEPGVQGEAAAVGAGVQLGLPGADAVRVELVVPGAVEAVGDVDPLAVPADLDHLRAAGQRQVGAGRVRGAGGDPAEPDRPGLP